MSNPITSDWVDLEVQGAQGHTLQVLTGDIQGRIISDQMLSVTGQTQRLHARVGSAAGVYLMQVRDGTRMQTVRIVHP